jgi:predicted SAM-dependent methyltransferase
LSRKLNEKIKLHIGCGSRVLKGWINIDLVYKLWENHTQQSTDEFSNPDVQGTKDDFLALDVTQNPLPFENNIVDVIFHEHFIERLDQHEAFLLLAETYRVLKPGGVQRIHTLDLECYMLKDSDFTQGHSGINQEMWTRRHYKNIFTKKYLEGLATFLGFQVVFQKRGVSVSPDVSEKYMLLKDKPEDSYIFADLIKPYGKAQINLSTKNDHYNFLQEIISNNLWPEGQPLRLHLGCGEQYLEGYINIDYPSSEHTFMKVKADIYADITKLDFPPESVKEIRLHHVFEHFNRVTALALLIKWHQWLRLGGKIWIETPDLIGSAKTIFANQPWSVKMGVVRHIAGSHEASWAYHIDHWFPERFEHTLKKLGFNPVQTLSWQSEPYLSNVHAVATKCCELTVSELIKAAKELLWESVIFEKEKSLFDLWCKNLCELIPHKDNQ